MRLFFLVVGLACGVVAGLGIARRRSAAIDEVPEPDAPDEETAEDPSAEVEYEVGSEEL